MTRARATARKPTTEALAIVANDELPQSRELMDRIAAEVFRGVVTAIQGVLRGEPSVRQHRRATS